MNMVFGFAVAAVLGGPLADWPVYRHDTRLTGVSPGKGQLTRPTVIREHWLGVPPVGKAKPPHVDPLQADLDGDGALERVEIHGKTLQVIDVGGRSVWSYSIDQTINAQLVRVRRVLPDSRGQQIVVFTNRMDTGDGRGYCFRFDEGLSRGKLQWSTAPLTGQHSPTMVIDDIDGDDLLEIVTAPHYRLQIFNAQTGAIESEVPWKVGRNYGLLTTRPAAHGGPHKDIFIVCDFVLHVDCIRFIENRWQHAWGHRYVEPNSPRPRGREQYLRVGPRAVIDVDSDKNDEMVYMLLDAAADDRWHLKVRECETGRVQFDAADIWLWSIIEMDGQPPVEVVYTPTDQKRPRTFCDVHIGRLIENKIADVAVIKQVRPVLNHVALPTTSHTIADEGNVDLLRSDMDGDGRPELYVGRSAASGQFSDTIQAWSLTDDGPLVQWQLARPGHPLDVVEVVADGRDDFRIKVHDRGDNTWLLCDADGNTIDHGKLVSGAYRTTPIVVDLDQDGHNEIVLQTAGQTIDAFQVPPSRDQPLRSQWSRIGVAMNPQPGYSWNGDLCPQSADVTGDGYPNVLFAAEDDQGLASIVCVDHHGRQVWQRSFPGCTWGGLQAGVNLWTFGRFTRRPRGLDVYVDIHRHSKGSGEGWVLRGDTGEVVWSQQGLVAKETAMPFGGGLPSIADVNQDGVDDIVQAFFTIYGALSGDTGQPLEPPRFLTSADMFGHWLAYSSPTVADLTGDGQMDVYLNSASYARGGYAAVTWQGEPLWGEFHNNDRGSNGFGPVGDFNGDGRVEIVVPVLDGSLLCLNAADGSHLWRIETPVAGDVSAADVNGDDQIELVYAGLDGVLRAVRGSDGHEIWAVKVAGRPIIADVTGDNLVEILAVGPDGTLRIVGQP